ncbi:MAG: hypothetical protein EAZ92_08095 [Candidatus Kapaibacterium sp.]|nr:MAG: hypothetical protein EAZ92_08095 [Candidatus Kapabacteria bacterium]
MVLVCCLGVLFAAKSGSVSRFGGQTLDALRLGEYLSEHLFDQAHSDALFAESQHFSSPHANHIFLEFLTVEETELEEEDSSKHSDSPTLVVTTKQSLTKYTPHFLHFLSTSGESSVAYYVLHHSWKHFLSSAPAA